MILINARSIALAGIITVVGLAPLGVSSSGVTAQPAQRSVVHQLRIYEIFEGNKQVFHQRFRDHAVRIMARHDFKILSMWETKHAGRTEFAYLLEWPDETTMRDRWAKFMADQEWSDIKQATRVHGTLVGDIQDRALVMTDYSPRTLQASR